MPRRGFRAAGNFPYRKGAIYLGRDPESGKEVGYTTERHCITIAGTGAGKGTCLIIPNLLRWPHNALVIDPKGENAEATAEHREQEFGHAVHVLDPFDTAKVPDRLKSRLNPLSTLRPDSIRITEELGIIADGLVLRHDPRHGYFDSGAVELLKGFMAQLLTTGEGQWTTLPELRNLLTLPDDKFTALIETMAGNAACGGLAQSAAASITRGKSGDQFLDGATQNTAWLNSGPMREFLSESTFDLSDIKTKPCTIYLVLPPELLGEHARFLRLFVRMAIYEMARGGRGGHECLFLLDEFYSLGRIDEISKSAGLMRGYGLKLWPFLQDLGQLTQLYTREGAETFFGNADIETYFGLNDPETAGRVSKGIGAVSVDEMPEPPSPPRQPTQKFTMPAQSTGDDFISNLVAGLQNSAHQASGETYARELKKFHEEQQQYQDEMQRYQQTMARVGRPRMAPEEVLSMVSKGPGDTVASRMIAFLPGGTAIEVQPAPYFQKAKPRPPHTQHSEPVSRSAEPPAPGSSGRKIFIGAAVLFVLFVIFASADPPQKNNRIASLPAATSTRPTAVPKPSATPPAAVPEPSQAEKELREREQALLDHDSLSDDIDKALQRFKSHPVTLSKQYDFEFVAQELLLRSSIILGGKSPRRSDQFKEYSFAELYDIFRAYPPDRRRAYFYRDSNDQSSSSYGIIVLDRWQRIVENERNGRPLWSGLSGSET